MRTEGSKYFAMHADDIALAIEDIVRATNNLAVEAGSHVNPPAWVLHLTVMFPNDADTIKAMAWEAYESL